MAFDNIRRGTYSLRHYGAGSQALPSNLRRVPQGIVIRIETKGYNVSRQSRITVSVGELVATEARTIHPPELNKSRFSLR